MYCIKTAERIIDILSPSDRPIILVFFATKGRCVNLTASPQRGRQIQGGRNFRPIPNFYSWVLSLWLAVRVVTVLSALLINTGWPNKNHTFLRYHIFAATTDIITRFLLKCSEITTGKYGSSKCAVFIGPPCRSLCRLPRE